MNNYRFWIIFVVLFANNALAQTISVEEQFHRQEISMSNGYKPKSLDSLVGTSSLIIKGRFGEFLSNELFYGFGNTRESLAVKYSMSESEIDRLFALPISYYEVIVDEVLLGKLDVSEITIRKFEYSPNDNRNYTDPAIDRLFFLTENPNGNYGIRCDEYILNNRHGNYGFYSRSQSEEEQFINKPLDFLADMEVQAFEQLLRTQIEVENTIRNYED